MAHTLRRSSRQPTARATFWPWPTLATGRAASIDGTASCMRSMWRAGVAICSRLVQKLPTLGATDFSAFEMGGVTYLAVSNEQDDWLGGDVRSVIWGLRDGWGKKWREQSSDGKRAIATTPKESCSEELD